MMSIRNLIYGLSTTLLVLSFAPAVNAQLIEILCTEAEPCNKDMGTTAEGPYSGPTPTPPNLPRVLASSSPLSEYRNWAMVAVMVYQVRRMVTTPTLENLASTLTPRPVSGRTLFCSGIWVPS